MKIKKCFFILFSFITCAHANNTPDTVPSRHLSVIGGGIVGALESYYAYEDAKKEGVQLSIDVYERGLSFDMSEVGGSSTNTSYNIAPSLTIDEILAVVPLGSELIDKLSILFSNPGGIRVDDVAGANNSTAALQFKEAVNIYALDKDHDDRTMSLLALGKKSMDLWQQMYDGGDAELKNILETSNFNPCREPKNSSEAAHLHDGYRVDLIYGIANAKKKALAMKTDYEQLGYKNCKVLSPDEVIAIDPFLTSFCKEHSEMDIKMHRVWKNDCAALWRPGGCIDIRSFLPKFYAYMKKIMGQCTINNQIQDCFQLSFGKEVTGVIFDSTSDNLRVAGLKFSDGSQLTEKEVNIDFQYVFCPGESVGTLHKLGFNEPAYAGFAGASLLLHIPLSQDQIEKYENFSHCMEVHNEGIVLAWQARLKENNLFIGVAGTKAFYGDKRPDKDEAFAKNRNLVQLNIINNVLPECISLAYGYPTAGKTLTAEELSTLEQKGIARRWVGIRAVAYDGFPTLGALYHNDQKVSNARCTTHLGSGGVSFGPGAVWISRNSHCSIEDLFIEKILLYSNSGRIAQSTSQ